MTNCWRMRCCRSNYELLEPPLVPRQQEFDDRRAARTAGQPAPPAAAEAAAGGPGGPPAPPGPLANALVKTPCSSLAWLLVSVPLCTCCEIRPLMVDCICDRRGRPRRGRRASLCSSLLMVLSAELNALSSDELMVPADTWDVSWFCSMVRGDCSMPLSDDIEDMGNSLRQLQLSMP